MELELQALKDGHARRFSEFKTLGSAVPNTGAGVYTIWDDDGGLVYVGIAGRTPKAPGWRVGCVATRRGGAAATSSAFTWPTTTFCLNSRGHRLRRFCDSALSMDALVRDCIHERFGFRFVSVDSYSVAMVIENAIKNGAVGQPPRLNPPTSR